MIKDFLYIFLDIPVTFHVTAVVTNTIIKHLSGVDGTSMNEKIYIFYPSCYIKFFVNDSKINIQLILYFILFFTVKLSVPKVVMTALQMFK